MGLFIETPLLRHHPPQYGRQSCTELRNSIVDRYYIAKDWTPKKLEVLVDVPDHLSLEHLRGTGLQPGEKAQPEVSALSCIMHLQHLDAEERPGALTWCT